MESESSLGESEVALVGVTVTTSVAMSGIFIELAGFITYSEESLLGPILDKVSFRESFLN